MTHEVYVTFEQAKALKELGFDWECYLYYNDDKKLWSYTSIGYGDDCRDWNDKDYAVIGNAVCSAPSLSQAQKWLREVKNIIVNVIIDDDSNAPWSYELLSTERDKDGDWVYLVPQWNNAFWSETPEEALSEGIDKALELLKEKSK